MKSTTKQNKSKTESDYGKEETCEKFESNFKEQILRESKIVLWDNKNNRKVKKMRSVTREVKINKYWQEMMK